MSSAQGPDVAERYFAGKLALSAGRFRMEAGERIAGPMRRGVKIGVLLEGRQFLAVDDRPAVTIAGPTLIVAANRGDHVQQRTGLAEGDLRCVLMQLDGAFVAAEFGAPAGRLLERVGPGGADIWTRPASMAICAIALQMAEIPVSDALRRLFLAGKALELAALALGEMGEDTEARPARLPARTRDCVHTARDLLVGRMQAPPSLAELARASGLNPTRLTSAFRAEFGMSVFAYLQEVRLRLAHELIASGEASIAEAAFRVGYTPAHFSGLFRKRFGLAPSALRP